MSTFKLNMIKEVYVPTVFWDVPIFHFLSLILEGLNDLPFKV